MVGQRRGRRERREEARHRRQITSHYESDTPIKPLVRESLPFLSFRLLLPSPDLPGELWVGTIGAADDPFLPHIQVTLTSPLPPPLSLVSSHCPPLLPGWKSLLVTFHGAARRGMAVL
ncbi:hypothetical protein E2C01_079360 [Portunus trituberculatus]|uniref:Uncharacterized protein n=1 Tax=Portunus trituberculatus TaxID=210409 RepID=A0A5B7ISJ6_PORTR|nr:hypothetical protein [Portunus trituberculatus]